MAEMTQVACDLTQKKCRPCEGGMPSLPAERVNELLRELPGWELHGGEIERVYTFRDYYQTLAFVNAVGWIAHREDHHPDMEVSYNKCRIRYSTHAIGGLSENDFICAAKVEALMESA